ncbi:MAG: penicillin-binding protein activator [Herminiimonas sp.]|nr:penicillin-binding protein activator [Herminiimonas sp.]
MTQDLSVTQQVAPETRAASVRLPPVPLPMPAFAEAQVTRLAAAPVSDRAIAPARVRVGLLLPMRSTSLRAAAEMVRDGIRAAHRRDGANVDLVVIETDDNPQNIAAIYRDAVPFYDVLVGPLSRGGVAAIATGGHVMRPTIALVQPEPASDLDAVLPPKMLVMGLSVEEEARQAASWAARQHPSAKALVLSTAVTWQRRAARAFVEQWQRGTASAEILELNTSGGQLDVAGLLRLKRRMAGESPGLIFVALDAEQTRQLRQSIGAGPMLYGTSQLNTLNLADPVGAAAKPELDGVRLLDLPWQLQADHPAVMIYPRPPKKGEQRRGLDLERLYALGIDAFRVAGELGAGRPVFTIDGVTGKLYVQLDGIRPATFERTEQQAQYAGGVVVALTDDH